MSNDSAIPSIGRSEEYKKTLKRMQDILTQNDGGFNADAEKAVNTMGWEKAW